MRGDPSVCGGILRPLRREKISSIAACLCPDVVIHLRLYRSQAFFKPNVFSGLCGAHPGCRRGKDTA
jgi:hypothetical protein